MTNSNNASPRPVSAFLVVVLLFLIYNANLRPVRTDDSVPARLLPFTILLDHSVYLDQWVEPYIPKTRTQYGAYFLARSNGHWMSAYPLILPVAVLPLYIAPAWWLARLDPFPPFGDIILVAVIDVMEKLAASLIAALSAGVLYLALRRVAPYPASLMIALIYGLASNTWSTSSQALWRHGFTELSLALLIWALLGDSKAKRYPFWIGLALALAAANKPADATLAVALFLYFAFYKRQGLALFLAPLVVLGSAALAYNYYFFHRLLGGYPSPLAFAGHVTLPPTRASFWDGLTGSLVSPNRGLLIFMPWTVAALWGAARIWRENFMGWGRLLILGVVGIYAEQAGLGDWWGGWCYGPRYLTDLLPIVAFFLVPVWPRLQKAPVLRAALVLAVVASLWVQWVGAFYYPNGLWDGRPQNVQVKPSRVWDWKDTEVARSFWAGRGTAFLYDDVYLLFSLPKGGGVAPPLKRGQGQKSVP